MENQSLKDVAGLGVLVLLIGLTQALSIAVG